METFITVSFGFPTVFWTALLLFCLLYWAVAMIGFADFDAPEIDPELPDGGLEGLTGLVSLLGLSGVPIPVALTSLSLSGWLICYFADLLLLDSDSSGFLATLISIAILIGSLIFAVKPSAWLVRPLKPLFKNTKSCNSDVLGKTGTVVYAISENDGVIDCMVNGAHLRLQARSSSDIEPGQKAVVIKYHKQDSVYQVVPEADFMTGLTR